ncbi:DNA-binding protein [Microbulbifer sp. ARAS458-1]
MARSGVGYIDIAKAAEALKQRGEEPTVDRVRAELGTGSKSTIAPLLKRWRTEVQGEVIDTGDLPRELVDALKELYGRVRAQADLEVEKIREESERIQGNLEQELAQTRSALSVRSAELEQLEQKLQVSEGEGRSLSRRLSTALSELEKSEFQRDEGAKRTEELKATVEELKAENRDIREHFEHYQQRMAEDRQQERDQARLVADQLRHQVASLGEQCAQRERSIAQLNQQLESAHNRCRELEAERQLLIADVEVQRGKLAETERSLLSLQQQLQQKSAECEQHLVQAGALDAQLSASIREVEWRQSLVDKLEIEVLALRDAVETLRQENRAALQEKAELQGRFRQLEQSLAAASSA